jgi:uncharacterized protein
MSSDTIRATANFLREGQRSIGLKSIRVDFHGGEPLLLGKARFSEACQIFQDCLSDKLDLKLSLQTNAILIDPEWIDIFSRFDVGVGVSLDGPPDYNDSERIDFRGRGTHSRTVRGVAMLCSAAAEGRITRIGVLCVINPKNSARRIYRYFVDDLGIDYMDFLLPDLTHDSFQGQDATAYGRFLCEAFDVWTEDDNPQIQVRVLNSVLSLMLGGHSWVDGYGHEIAPALTISSSGSIGPNDLLRACGPEIMRIGADVRTATLQGYFDSEFRARLETQRIDLARTCLRCCWLEVCGGGLLVHRYQKASGFKNPSVLCDGLKMLYSRVAAHLLSNGLPLNRLRKVLIPG